MTKALIRNRSLFPFGPFWEDVFNTTMAAPATEASKLRPALDVEETDEAIQVSIELPGMTKDEVNVSIEDGVLTVSGEKAAKTENEDSNYHIIERSYGSFARSLSLPAHIAADKAAAKFEHGVLVIKLPKMEAAKPKRLEIE